MSDYIPFVNSAGDQSTASSIYASANFFRIGLQSPEKTVSHFPTGSRLWLDASVDALHCWPMANNQSYRDYFANFATAAKISDPTFQGRPDKKIVAEFVNAVLDSALNRVANPEWVSVPQLPYLDGALRNKVNRLLADSAQTWRAKSSYRGKFILPIILTNQRQVNKKTERNSKIAQAVSCYESSGAAGIWVVDSSLNDQDGTGNFEQTRFPGIINFHQELSAKITTSSAIIAGPYWALNLILWARGLVHFPAIGKGYQYYIPGGRLMKGVVRVALGPLRRLAIWSSDLKIWIENSLSRIPETDPAHHEFSTILRNFQVLSDEDQARLQVARFYNDWFNKLQATAPQGRALALYQDFSSAYVLGKSLKDLPSRGNQARSASRLAKQFMGNCL